MPALPPLTVFDIETTGLDPRKGHRIIEIAGVRVADGIIDHQKAFVSFVNPEIVIPPEAKQINRIRDEDVLAAPTIDVVLPRFLEFAAGSLLIAHNATFDYGFLEREKQYCWGFVELPECLCTMKLGQSLYPSDFRYSLDSLCKKFNMDIPQLRHRALTDALLTAEVLLKMLTMGKILTLDDLRKRAAWNVLVKGT